MQTLKLKTGLPKPRLFIITLLLVAGLWFPMLAHALGDSTVGCDPKAKIGEPGYCGQKVELGQNTACSGGNSAQTCLQSIPFIKTDLQSVVDFLSGAVGIVVVGVIILGGIQYTMAGDNAQAVTAAKSRITNGLIALVAFLFVFAFLQWLIPGGIFG